MDAAASAIEKVARVLAHIRRRWPRVSDSVGCRLRLRGARPTASTSCSDWPRTSGSSPRSRPIADLQKVQLAIVLATLDAAGTGGADT
jgi:hypothetical protein